MFFLTQETQAEVSRGQGEEEKEVSSCLFLPLRYRSKVSSYLTQRYRLSYLAPWCRSKASEHSCSSQTLTFWLWHKRAVKISYKIHQNVRVSEGIATSKTKQDFGLTGFPEASSRVSAGTAGTNDGEAPAIHLHFGLPYRWAGMQ